LKIAIGSDHGGYALKEQIRRWVAELGHEVDDLGCDSADSVDYPVYAIAVARKVASGAADLGILVCGTGLGMSMAANKVKGVRAAVCNDLYCAEHARAHNDANVMTIGARVVNNTDARQIVEVFLNTKFEGGRHARRVDQIMAIEEAKGE
jgi:ribose 5-phosphate isomerase B